MRYAFVLGLLAAQASAQPVEQSPLGSEMSLLRAGSDLELADSAYARARHLFDRRLLSAAELELRRAEREHAVLTVLERWSALAAATPRLRVVHAFKARSSAGSPVARIRVGISALDSIVAWPGAGTSREILARLRSARIDEAFISLKDEAGPAGTAIGAPYERRIDAGVGGGIFDLEFRLLRDVDAVVISLASSGRLDERKVLLEADASGAISVQPLPFSQEADVGTDASYDLTIERFGGDDAPVRLFVEGLPASVAHSFTDVGSGVRLSQLRFAAGEHQRRIRLTLTLPTPDAEAIVVDRAYRFRVIAMVRGTYPGVDTLSTDVARDPTGAGVAELELVPRGVGRAELRVGNLFHEVAIGEPALVTVTVRNTGSRVLDRARLLVEPPPGWKVAADPVELRDLAPDAELPVNLTITSSEGRDLGDYEIRLRIEGTSGRARVATDPTVIRVRIQARGGSLAVGALLGGLLVAAAGTVVVARRLATR